MYCTDRIFNSFLFLVHLRAINFNTSGFISQLKCVLLPKEGILFDITEFYTSTTTDKAVIVVQDQVMNTVEYLECSALYQIDESQRKPENQKPFSHDKT